jgi:hypothetical protein
MIIHLVHGLFSNILNCAFFEGKYRFFQMQFKIILLGMQINHRLLLEFSISNLI